MKRWLFASCVLLLLFNLVGCNTTENEGSSKESSLQPTAGTENRLDYGIDKIIVPVETQWYKGLLAYQDFNVAVVKEIAKQNDVEVQVEEIPTFEDSVKAVKRGDVDVVLGASNSSSVELSGTYSYLSSALYFPDGTQIVPSKDYMMLVKNGNDNLLNLLNDGIRELNKNGKLGDLQDKYLGQRENKEHPTLGELTSYDHISSLSVEERAAQESRLAKYKENKE
ncbi:transporter substrate-binding domain-containing protein [Priestia megaterium]|uniref:transporter substrate-binding domain-containing protein n=1 Tax=Priestia megaterium TaxID=1404 RepID=UPI002FFE68C6